LKSNSLEERTKHIEIESLGKLEWFYYSGDLWDPVAFSKINSYWYNR